MPVSTSGKIADRIAAKKQAEHVAKKKALLAKKAPVKKARPKKIAVKKAKPAAPKKVSKALKQRKEKIALAIKKLGLISAGFGRYHKAKGDPITHWVMRSSKTGLPLLVNKKARAKLLGKPLKVGAKKAVKTTQKKAAPVSHKKMLAMHVARLDAKRAAALKAKGRSADTPMTPAEIAARKSSVRKLRRVLTKHLTN